MNRPQDGAQASSTQTPTVAHSLADGGYVVSGPTGAVALPGRPRPEYPDAPALQIIALGDATVVQAGFCWPLAEEAIRRDLLSTAALPVQSAVTDMPEVDLVLHDKNGPRVVATTRTSGYPPYTAVVSVTVDSATAGALQRALDGEPGLATVIYRAHADGLLLDRAAQKQSAARGVAIEQDRKVTAIADVSEWARHNKNQE